MLDAVAALVDAESPSSDIALLDSCATVVAGIGADATGCPPQVIRVDGRPHLEWRFGGHTDIVLIGHFDTVWPAGTVSQRPLRRDGDRMMGPGALDMKAGIVQLFHALTTLRDLDGLTVLLTSDEELGSQTSRQLVEAAARGAKAALVFEPAAGHALKTARKGTGMYTLHVSGRAAHAGLEPEKGANALIEAANLVLALHDLERVDIGTTVTPTMAEAGSASNAVPSAARVEVDVRVLVPEEAGRVDDSIRALQTLVPGTSLRVTGGPNRPPMPAASADDLFRRAQQAAGRLGIAPLTGATVGGASDGNFTAAVGTPTLDGLGAVGEGAHAESEYLIVPAMPERAALAAELVEDIRGR
jgi:glutamate carboxypeptidase